MAMGFPGGLFSEILGKCWEIPPKSYGVSENVGKYHENPI